MSKMPLIGLGTWRLQGKECVNTVEWALQLGYRHIDTADMYENHRAIGEAIRPHPRKKIFLTTKLAMTDLFPQQVKQSVPRFLRELGTDYIDLLLIHWPNPDVDLVKTVEAMLEMKKQGAVRAIGVSNFVRSHLEALAPHHFPIATNQIEMHPYLQRKLLVAACEKWGIAITAYRPLAKGAFEKDPILKQIGARYGKSASQVALRWLIQQDITVIPKASTLEHLKENLAIFDFHLTETEMHQIEQLDQGKRFCAPEGMPLLED